MLLAVVLVGLCSPALAQTPQGSAQSAAAQRDRRFEELMHQGDAARAAGLPEAAVKAFGEAAKLRPRSFEAWWSLGTSAYEVYDYALAREGFASAAAIRPQDGPPWTFLGLCEFQAGQYGEAMNHIQKGLGLGLTLVHELVRRVPAGDPRRCDERNGTGAGTHPGADRPPRRRRR